MITAFYRDVKKNFYAVLEQARRYNSLQFYPTIHLPVFRRPAPRRRRDGYQRKSLPGTSKAL
jgi:hypothetical protein